MNTRNRKIRIEEKTDTDGTYIAEILEEDKCVYHAEIPVKGRFSLMKAHDDFLQIAQEYEKSGKLPSRAARLLRR